MAGLGDLWDLVLASLEATLFTIYLFTFRATRSFLQVRFAALSLPLCPLLLSVQFIALVLRWWSRRYARLTGVSLSAVPGPLTGVRSCLSPCPCTMLCH